MKKQEALEKKRKYAREYMRKYYKRKQAEKALVKTATQPTKSQKERVRIVDEFLESLKKVLLTA